MPKMPKRVIEIPAEFESAADAALDQGLLMSRAKDMFNYALLTRLKKRNGDNLSQAALEMGMNKQAVDQYLKRLEVRLSA